MYCLVVYDMPVYKVTKVHKFLKKRLNWIQNSVFEWELSQSEFVKMKGELKKLVVPKKWSDDEAGSAIIFSMPYMGAMERTIIGEEKSPIDNFI
jgi:CRISPR-associated protein Cas2